MPLKFTLEEQVKSIDADAAECLGDAPSPAAPAHQAEIAAFRGSVETWRILNEQYQELRDQAAEVEGRIAKGVEYAKANPGDGNALAWLAKFRKQRGELEKRMIGVDDRIGREAERQHQIERQVTGGNPAQYLCPRCFRLAGMGMCRCDRGE